MNRIRWATLFWIGVSRRHRLDRRARVSRAGSRDRVDGCWPAGSRQIAAGNLEARIDEDGAATSSASSARAFNPMADRARRRAPARSAADRRDHGLEPDAGEARRGRRRASCARRRTCCCARARWRRWASWARAWRTRSTTRSPACWASRSCCIADLPREPPGAAAAAGHRDAGAAHPQDRAEHAAVRAAAERARTRRPLDLPRVLDDAIELCGPSDLARAGIAVVRDGTPADARRCAAAPPSCRRRSSSSSRTRAPRCRSGGTLTIETSVTEDEAGARHRRRHRPGISAEHLPRIFDPFFTTKERLAGHRAWACRSCTRPSRTTAARSRSRATLGKGTTFMLTFPAYAGRRGRSARHDRRAQETPLRPLRRPGLAGAGRRRGAVRRDAALAHAVRAADAAPAAAPVSTGAHRAASAARRGPRSAAARPRARTCSGWSRRPGAASRPTATVSGCPIQRGDLLTRPTWCAPAPARAPSCSLSAGDGDRAARAASRSALDRLSRRRQRRPAARQGGRARAARQRHAGDHRARHAHLQRGAGALRRAGRRERAGCRSRRSRARRGSRPAGKTVAAAGRARRSASEARRARPSDPERIPEEVLLERGLAGGRARTSRAPGQGARRPRRRR